MKKLLTIIIFTFFGLSNLVYAQAPAWHWAKASGGNTVDDGNSIALDINGNSYVTGLFQSTSISFGSITLINTDTDGSSDMFIVKYDVSGNVIWAKSEGGTGNDVGVAIAVDGSGNSYVTGTYRFGDIIIGGTTFNNVGGEDIFIVKYDASGNVVWAKSPVSFGGEKVWGIAVDGIGNSYVTGSFGDDINFGSTILNNNTTSLDMFIVKYDVSGNVVWAKAADGTSIDEGFGVAVDSNGNSYVTGKYASPSITFGSSTVSNSNAGYHDMFIVKYDVSGNVVWAKAAGGSSHDFGNGIAVDGIGNSYVTGHFSGSNVAFGSVPLTSVGTYDMFIVKYNTSGIVVWAKSMGGTGGAEGFGIAIDGSGNSYVTGRFYSSAITFGGNILNYQGGGDMFIVKYDPNGAEDWAKTAGYYEEEKGNSIAVSGSGDAYATGYFRNSVAFGSTTLNSAGNNDIFIVKLNSVVGIEELEGEVSFSIAPNPFTYQTKIVFNENQKNTTIKIMDLVGKEISKINFTGKELIVEKETMNSGIYFLQIADENKNIVNKKIIVQ